MSTGTLSLVTHVQQDICKDYAESTSTVETTIKLIVRLRKRGKGKRGP